MIPHETDFTYVMHLPRPAYTDLLERIDGDTSRSHYRDHYCLVLHILTAHLRSRFKELRRIGAPAADWSACLSSVLLHQMLGNAYKPIVDDLVEWGFIWRSKSYLVGTEWKPGKCKAYGFRSRYGRYLWRYLASREEYYGDDTGVSRKFGMTQKVKVKDHCLLKRLRAYLCDVKATQLEDDMVHLCHDNLSEHFHVDEGRASEILSDMVAKGDMTVHGAKQEMEKVIRFNSAGDDDINLYVKKDPYGRIHTNMTNLKKEIRRDCLECDGGPVGGVDIKSSQGAFLCSILGRFTGEDSLYVTSDPYLERMVHRCEWLRGEALDGEYRRYRTLLSERRLYEFFASELSQDLDLDREVGRSEAKKEFLAMLFARTHIDWRKKPVRAAVRRVWEEHFPRLLRCIDEMKRESHASLAHLMQRIESSFVFERVVPAVMDEIGCPFCTVHDSIIVPEAHVAAVKAIMDRELAVCGIPTATAEEYAVVHPDDRIREYRDAVREEMLAMCGIVADCGPEDDTVTDAS